jgi:outer membrane protein assembly factor BamB
MTSVKTDETTLRKPLRLWPGVVAVVLLWLVWFGVPLVVPGAGGLGVMGGVVGGLAVLVWWLFFSCAPWSERLGAIGLIVAALFATRHIVHESVANGMMGMMLPIFAIPVLSLALVCWAVASRRLSRGPRRVSMVASILLACGVFTLLRTGGLTGDADSDLHWRWTKTPEERLLAQPEEPTTPTSVPATPEIPEKSLPAQGATEPTPPTSPPATVKTPKKQVQPPEPTGLSAALAGSKTEVEWPGFRGTKRDGIIRGVRIETDWSRQPPTALWRRPIGPGWSSFAVHGNFIYTQEQRGDDELVSSYNLSNGAPVWKHRDAVRFYESNGGAGPRATPTFSGGRIYTFGATGILNALDARNGPSSGRAMPRPIPRGRFPVGASRVRRWWLATSSSSPPPARSPPTTSSTAIHVGSVRPAALATARHSCLRSTASHRSCC